MYVVIAKSSLDFDSPKPRSSLNVCCLRMDATASEEIGKVIIGGSVLVDAFIYPTSISPSYISYASVELFAHAVALTISPS